ncbi:MAG: VWA domain-containing protein [Vicinamibacterales bacterium]
MRTLHHLVGAGVAILLLGGRSDVSAQAPGPAPAPEPPIVRITSPLGRTGVVGTVRIVAQIESSIQISLARFTIDGKVLTEVQNGPPWVAEWFDENPFEPKQITVEAWDWVGQAGKDTVDLASFEITDEVQVSSVLVEASVHDPNGRSVKGLEASSFVLQEDGIDQTIEAFAVDTVPSTFALLVDSSQSMARRVDFVQRTAENLTNAMGPRDQMLVVPFTRRLGPVTGPTSDRQTVIEAIEAIRPSGGTAIADSLIALQTWLENAEGRRVVILITDGYDEHSQESFQAAVGAVIASQASVYVVGIGGVAGISLKGERELRQLAVQTGGRAFFPSRDEQLTGVREALVDEVQNRYLLAYTPSNQMIDGAWREISLTTSDPGHVVRARAGYFAPKPSPVRPTIEFTVTDSLGEYLDLAVDDLEVIEDGVAQSVETFQDAVTPVSIILAMDASGSMRRSVAEVIEAARQFVLALRPEDRLAVMLFADQPLLELDLTDNRSLAVKAIDTYKADGGTALYDAVGQSMERLNRVQGRRAVVVLTDGRDEDNPGTGPGSIRSLEQVLEAARETRATIFGVALGTQVDREALEQLARVSGGQVYSPTDVTELADNYREVVENLRRRYVISYTSTNGKRDGGWRAVEIRVRSTGATVFSPEGYFAPSR